MKHIFATSVIILASFVFFNGCKKDNTDTDTTSTTDNAICEGEFMRVLPTVNKIAIDEPGIARQTQNGPITFSSGCAVVTVTGSNWPKTMTIDYGTGCTDPVDGKTRKGKLVCTISNHWDTVGTTVTIVPDTFFVNNIQFFGTVTLTRLASNQFRKQVQNGKCMTSNWTILWDCDRTITFLTNPNDTAAVPKVSVSGTNSGTDRKGTTFTSTISSSNPIIRDMSCSGITKGTVTLTPAGKAARTIDFGDGSCDNRATVTINGTTFEFTMQ